MLQECGCRWFSGRWRLRPTWIRVRPSWCAVLVGQGVHHEVASGRIPICAYHAEARAGGSWVSLRAGQRSGIVWSAWSGSSAPMMIRANTTMAPYES